MPCGGFRGKQKFHAASAAAADPGLGRGRFAQPGPGRMTRSRCLPLARAQKQIVKEPIERVPALFVETAATYSR